MRSKQKPARAAGRSEDRRPGDPRPAPPAAAGWLLEGSGCRQGISRHLFALFGLGNRLQRERAKASQRLKQKAQQWALKAEQATHAGLAQLALALTALPGKLGGTPKRKHKPPDDWEHRRQRDITALELKQTFPHWTRQQLLDEAERRLLGRAPHRA